jgi:phosphoribosylaminoimidazole (AIR) synthetase
VLATGRVAEDEAWRTFNMGLGMCVVVPAGQAATAVAALGDARAVGAVEAGTRGVRVA